VHGCGGVGLSAIMIASALGANVIAIDIGLPQLALARELGAVATVDASQSDDVIQAVRELTGGGSHVSIDALGSQQTCFNSISGLRKRGRHVQVGLMTGNSRHPEIPMDRVLADELEIVGSHGMQAHRYPEMMSMIEQGKLNPEKLVGKNISLHGSLTALVDMNQFSNIGVTVINEFA